MQNNCEPTVVLEFYCLFFRTSWGVGIPNSAILNSFHNWVEFGTILEGLRNFGGGGGGCPPPLGKPLVSAATLGLSELKDNKTKATCRARGTACSSSSNSAG